MNITHIHVTTGLSAPDRIVLQTDLPPTFPFEGAGDACMNTETSPGQGERYVHANFPDHMAHVRCATRGVKFVSYRDSDQIYYTTESGDVAEDAHSLMDSVGLGQYASTNVEVTAWDDDRLVGVVVSHGDEWSVAVEEDYQRREIGTTMIRVLIASGEHGYMVAGTDSGADWLYSLFHLLSEDEREHVDVPLWSEHYPPDV